MRCALGPGEELFFNSHSSRKTNLEVLCPFLACEEFSGLIVSVLDGDTLEVSNRLTDGN